MNTKAWENLIKTTHQLTIPGHAGNLLSKSEMTELHFLLKEVMQTFLNKGQMHIGLKTYINKELRNEMTEHMLASPPSSYDSLEQWAKQIFGDERFGMILNSLEDYSNTFSEKAAQLIQPLLKMAGMPLNGLSFLFFMGNYGFTPFGVHKEAAGEEGFLFHLGPGNKQFYTWDDKDYNAIEHNTKVFHDYDAMMPNAKCYELEPGDAMFIPHQVYHIANTSEFSLSFVMDYINPSIDNFENQLLKTASEEALLFNKNYLKPIDLNEPITEVKDVLNPTSILQKMEKALQKKLFTLKSNGGISKPSNAQRGALLPNGSFSIQGKSIFPLFMEENASVKTIIFARGHQFVKKNHPNLSNFIHQLNNGKVLDFNQLRTTFEPEWDLTDIYSLVEDLLRIEAIEVANE